MQITISGLPGSGKSTLAKCLAKKLKLKHYCAGDIMRELARKKGISLLELSNIAEKDTNIDKEIDSVYKELAKKDNIIVDSRLGFYFLPKSIKLFLVVDPVIGARRVWTAKRMTEQENISPKQTARAIKKRIESERQRYKKLYNIDHTNTKNYDIVLDTSYMNVEQMNDAAFNAIKKFIAESKRKITSR